MSILKSSVIYRQLLFYSDAFLRVKFIEKMLQVHLTPCSLARLQDIKPWMHISQLQKAFPDIWSWANAGGLKIKLTSKRNNQYQGRLLPPEGSDWECFFIFLLPSLTIYGPCSGIIRKIMLAFIYLRSLQKWVIQPPNNCWCCHTARDPMVLSFPKYLLSVPQFLWQKLSPLLYCVRFFSPAGPFPSLCLTTPNIDSCIQTLQREEHRARVTKIKLPMQSTHP